MGFKPSGRDWIFFSGFFLSAGVVAITGTMPLRVAKGEITGWPTREIGVFGQTTVTKTREIWSWWRKETCDKYIIAQDQLNSQTTVRIADVESDTHVQGIGQNCLTNRACRSHAAVHVCNGHREGSRCVLLIVDVAEVHILHILEIYLCLPKELVDVLARGVLLLFPLRSRIATLSLGAGTLRLLPLVEGD